MNRQEREKDKKNFFISFHRYIQVEFIFLLILMRIDVEKLETKQKSTKHK